MHLHAWPRGRFVLSALATLAAAVLIAAFGRDSRVAAAIPPGPFDPGDTYYGTDNYVEYLAGSSPIILSVPHDGDISDPVPARDEDDCDFSSDEDGWNTAADGGTQSLTRKMAVEFHQRTGRWPHVIYNRLHRSRLDANRTMEGGACGIAQSEEAWRDYHDFLNVAKTAAIAQFGKAWYVDVHGHGHTPRRIELGYRVSKADLNNSGGDAHLNSGSIQFNSTIRRIAEESHLPFATVLRGAPSLGDLFDGALYPSIPSTRYPGPGTADFFPGAYNVKIHTCIGANPPTEVCGLQLELYSSSPAAGLPGIRDSDGNQQDFAEAIVGVFETYLGLNLGLSMTSRAGETIVDNDNVLNDPDRGTFSVMSPSDWSSSTTHGTIQHNQLITTVPAGGGAPATGVEFRWQVEDAGTYSVYAWWTSDASRNPNTLYRVYRSEGLGDRVLSTELDQRINGGRWNLLGTWAFPANTTGRVFIGRSVGSGTISADAIRAVRHDGTGVLPPQPPRPRGWYSRDIGPVGTNGTGVGDASESGGAWTVDGAGADIWGTSDAFHYTYRWLQGDGSITARVADIDGTADWTKVGVMMRGTAAANSAHAFMLVANPAKGVAFQYRLANGGTTTNIAAGTGSAPRWVRLTRSGSAITAAVSSDGVAWTNVSTKTYSNTAMPTNILVGLAVSSHIQGTTATGVFDSLSVVQ